MADEQGVDRTLPGDAQAELKAMNDRALDCYTKLTRYENAIGFLRPEYEHVGLATDIAKPRI